MAPGSKHSQSDVGISARPSEEIAQTLKLEKGLGFLVRLLNTRAVTLYDQLTGQDEIAPRQSGVASDAPPTRHTDPDGACKAHPRADRSTLGEMINRMAERSLIAKRGNGNDRRSAEVTIAPAGTAALLRVVKGAARLQNALLAPLAAKDRAHFTKCDELVAEPPSSARRDRRSLNPGDGLAL